MNSLHIRHPHDLSLDNEGLLLQWYQDRQSGFPGNRQALLLLLDKISTLPRTRYRKRYQYCGHRSATLDPCIRHLLVTFLSVAAKSRLQSCSLAGLSWAEVGWHGFDCTDSYHPWRQSWQGLSKWSLVISSVHRNLEACLEQRWTSLPHHRRRRFHILEKQHLYQPTECSKKAASVVAFWCSRAAWMLAKRSHNVHEQDKKWDKPTAGISQCRFFIVAVLLPRYLCRSLAIFHCLGWKPQNCEKVMNGYQCIFCQFDVAKELIWTICVITPSSSRL